MPTKMILCEQSTSYLGSIFIYGELRLQIDIWAILWENSAMMKEGTYPQPEQETPRETLCKTCPFAVKGEVPTMSEPTGVRTGKPAREASLEERVARIRREDPALYRQLIAKALASIEAADYWD